MLKKRFDDLTDTTIGMDIATKHVKVDNMTLNIQLWDIAGQDHFIGLAPTFYRKAVAAIVVFDITNGNSLDNAKKWKIDVDDKVFLGNGEHIPCILFANKWDLIEQESNLRQVSDNELDKFCHDNNFIGWFSTSAKSGLNIRKGMNFIVGKIIENQKKDLKITKNNNKNNNDTNDDEYNEENHSSNQHNSFYHNSRNNNQNDGIVDLNRSIHPDKNTSKDPKCACNS